MTNLIVTRTPKVDIPSPVIFDGRDIDHILTMPDGETVNVYRFTPTELRRQIHACDVQAAVCLQFGEDDWAAIYEDLKRTMGLALDILISDQPKTKGRPGKESIDIAALKARNDIVDVAARYTTLRKSGQNFTGLCPLHHEKAPSFYVFPDRQSWRCFGACSRGGDVIALVMAAEHLDFMGAVEALR